MFSYNFMKNFPPLVSILMGSVGLTIGVWSAWASNWVKLPQRERGLFRQCTMDNGTYECQTVTIIEPWLLAVRTLILAMLVADIVAICAVVALLFWENVKLQWSAAIIYLLAGICGISGCLCFTVLKERSAPPVVRYGAGFIVAWPSTIGVLLAAVPLIWTIPNRDQQLQLTVPV